MSYKWWSIVIAGFATFTLLWYALFPIVDYLFVNLKDATVLRDSLA